MKFLFLLCASILLSATHDVPIAQYTLFKENSDLFLKVEFDAEDVYEQLHTNDHLFKESLLKDYFQQHFQLYFDWCPVEIQISDFQQTSHHFQLKAKLLNVPVAYSHIQVENTCLLHIENHSNVIQFMLKERQRDFLMNKQRTQISVKAFFE